MPLVFIHGVSVRNDDPSFEQTGRTRRKLMTRLLLEPLAKAQQRPGVMSIVEPYWGDVAAEFAWNMETLPTVRLLESFGNATGTDAPDSNGDAIFETTVQTLSAPQSQALETYGAGDRPLTRAAKRDLRMFLEALVAPVAVGEKRLTETGPDDEAALDATLAQAVFQASQDQAVRDSLDFSQNDADTMRLLRAAVEKKFKELIPLGPSPQPQPPPQSDQPPPSPAKLETYGPQFADGALLRIKELFDRAASVPSRAASVGILAARRARLHSGIARFEGDVFTYLIRRGTPSAPGPIVQKVLTALNDAVAQSPGEALIVVTHSMGGNILYDILTTYAPKLKVDVWFSVGGQVGFFEEMKLFQNSDPAIRSPQKVSKPATVERWVNVYDPVDILSFLASPVFDGVEDVEYHTGADVLKSHGEYFGRASLYDIMQRHVLEVVASQYA